MLNRNFYWNIVVRLGLITLSIWIFLILIHKEERWFTLFSLVFLLVTQLVLLIRYINAINRNLYSFFAGIKNQDSMLVVSEMGTDDISKDLIDQLNDINIQLSNIKAGKEIQAQYFQNVLENVGTGLISLRKDGKVDFINYAAKQMLDLPDISHIDKIQKLFPGLFKTINDLHSGEQQLVKLQVKDELLQLSVKATEFILKQETYKLISFQNIRHELEDNELDSWQKLIRVLTHEISNSVSPITSLASSLGKFYRVNVDDTDELDDSIKKKTLEGLDIIKERGDGLINFVQNYRNLTLIPDLKFETIKLAELIYNVEILMKDKLDAKGVKLNNRIYPFDLEVLADKKYIEQILINLLKNAIEAVESNSNPEININALQTGQNRVIIQVSDNGSGIPEDVMEKIFIPFFSTKDSGSGIGLSLARQIMRMHGGSISTQSIPGQETVFTLVF